jgi:hypothetical protein
MAKQITERPTKWELRREDNVCTQIIKWDLNRSKRGPVSIETIWKQWILDEWENSLDEEEGGKRKRK